jgi:hypothetical protein
MASMNPSTKSSWWHNATTEQRLAQIDGGIECGMTVRQVAMASRAPIGTVQTFATRHDRRFPLKTKSTSAGFSRNASKMRDRAAYFSGRPADFWGNTEAQEEFLDEREGA